MGSVLKLPSLNAACDGQAEADGGKPENAEPAQTDYLHNTKGILQMATRKLDTLKATEFTHAEYGTIYQNSYGAYWVKNDDDTVCPLE